MGAKVALYLHQTKEKASVSCVPCTLIRCVPAARASRVAQNTPENVRNTKKSLGLNEQKAKLAIFDIRGG